MACKYLIIKLNKKYGCKLIKKKNNIIDLSQCINCKQFKQKEYKKVNYTNKDKCLRTSLKKPLKQVSNKRAKLEKNRYSILVNDLNVCAVCGSKYNIAKHEIYWGKNRQNSMKYGLVIGLCKKEHHTIGKFAIHNNKKLNEYWRSIARKRFEEVYSNLDFTEIFKSK